MSETPSQRPVLRFLRVGLAWLSIALGVVTVCLWVRSRLCTDEVAGGFSADHRIDVYTRPDGLRIRFDETRTPIAPAWRWHYVPPERQQFRSPIFPWEQFATQFACFVFGHSPGHWALAIPFWFLTLACALAAVLSAPRPFWRFSLRRLMTLITFVAVVLGAVIALSRQRH
jgi:hypothetical protein